ncbi:MAG: hypothetical protein EXQ52_01330 [Bryobacterales bacterium]|nr:hypothetical protein [Bryobacterales bacterium]
MSCHARGRSDFRPSDLHRRGNIPGRKAAYWIPSTALLAQVLNGLSSDFQAVPLTVEIALAVGKISRSCAGPAYRAIAATALALRLPLVTCDGKIRVSGTKTIW